MFKKNKDNLIDLKQAWKTVAIPDGFQYQLPPNSFEILKGEFIDYEKRNSLVTKFNIAKMFSNPQGTVQGGILTACFDDTFGPLGISAARYPVVTIDINIQFIRPVKLEEDFFIEAKVISLNHATIYMQGAAFNTKGKLLAKASTNQMLIKATNRAQG